MFMRTKNLFQMAALMLGMTMTSVTMTSCSANDDNPVTPPNIPGGVGQAQVKELSELTTAEIGWVIAADSKAYPNAATAKETGTEPLAMVASIKGTEGLAIQVTCSEDMSYDDAKKYIESLPKVQGHARWELPSLSDWVNMLAGCAVEGDATGFTGGKMEPVIGFRDKFAAAGLTWENRWFWTSTSDDQNSDLTVIVGTNIFYNWGGTPQVLISTASKSLPYWTRGLLYFEVAQ